MEQIIFGVFTVTDLNRVATPTATEIMLPWKRDGEEDSAPIQQNEFPAWASNKEYLAYNSPSATFLGKMSSFIIIRKTYYLKKSQ